MRDGRKPRTTWFSAYSCCVFLAYSYFGTTTPTTTTITVVQAYVATPPMCNIRAFSTRIPAAIVHVPATTKTTTTTDNKNKLFIHVRTSSVGVAAASSTRSSDNNDDDDNNNNSNNNNDDYDDWYADYDPSEFESKTPFYSYDKSGNGNGNSNNNSNSNRHGHDYQRDTSVDNSNIDSTTVHALIAERLQARKTGQFDTADAIRDQLLDEHGVVVWDREKKWRSGCSRSGSGMKKQWNHHHHHDDRRNQRYQKGRAAAAAATRRYFGPTGHDYELSADAGPNQSPFSESEIHQQIAQRLECKLTRNFGEADEIQQELRNAGVHIHDGLKEWRADGQPYGNVRGGSGSGSGSSAATGRRGPGRIGDPYVQSPKSLPTDDNNIDAIQALIEERMQAKLTRSYDVADDIQQQLRDMYNVEVNDKLRLWSVGGNFRLSPNNKREPLQPYRQSELSQATDHAETIQSLVENREEARKQRDFATADDIRDELRYEYNVVVNDKTRQWSVGGQMSAGTKTSQQARSPDNGMSPGFVRRGGGDLTLEDEAQINDLIRQRDQAKRNKQFGKADGIRDKLRDEYTVRIDDRSREWMIATNEFVMSPVSDIDDETRAHIEKRIAKRAVAKLNKDYETADTIRDELFNDYQVYLDDRVKEWRIEGLASSKGDTLTTFAEDEDSENDNVVVLDDFETTAVTESSANRDSYDVDYLSSLTVLKLKDKLREAGLPVTGRKAELIERLTASSKERK